MGKVIPLLSTQDHDDDDVLPSIADLLPPSELSEQAQRLIEYATRRGGRLPKSLSKASIKEQFDSVFEMIGGMPRLAIWADQNPSQFYAHYAKLLPAQAKVDLSIPDPSTLKANELTTAELKLLVLRAASNESH